MRVLLTGGTGFVGKAVCRRLACNGDVVGQLVRRTPTGPPDNEPYVLGTGKWSEAAMAEAMSAFLPDAIIHLAGGPDALSIELLYELNVFLGERIMATAALICPEARILIVGSAAEYGAPAHPDGTSREDDIPRPGTHYGIAKLAQTLHALSRARSGQPIGVARLFNPVGPGMPHGLAFADFKIRLAHGANQLATGDIDSARDFMAVDDAARILSELIRCSGVVGKVVNVCSGVAQPVRHGLDRMILRTGRQIELVRNPAFDRPSAVRVSRGDTAGLEMLGILPAASDISSALDALMDPLN